MSFSWRQDLRSRTTLTCSVTFPRLVLVLILFAGCVATGPRQSVLTQPRVVSLQIPELRNEASAALLELENQSAHTIELAYKRPAWRIEAGQGQVVVDAPHVFYLDEWNFCEDSDRRVRLPGKEIIELWLRAPTFVEEVDYVAVNLWYQLCDGDENISSVSRLEAVWTR